MDHHELELLAPAGRWDVLEQVIASGADAVYLGGKGFNMRMLRPDFNFSEQEIIAAIALAHEKARKLYITVNNLYNDRELDQIKDYLLFLADSGVDGFIVQDMGIVQLYKELKLSVPLHASVQMGIANLPAAKYLEDLGFSRAILSKNLSIEEISAIYQKTDLKIEFFVHGDLCISHTGQCHLSSFLTSESSNRGRCIKPCRWQYSLYSDDNDVNYRYLLASNDLCLYQYLPELIKAGVMSFKIEGRMRDKEYISHLVKIYRRALDRIINDPESYTIDNDEVKNLEKRKIRNFTAGNLLGKPYHDYVDTTGGREPFPPSKTVDLEPLTFTDKPVIIQTEGLRAEINIKELTVKVNSLESAVQAIKNGADNLIVGLEKFRQTDVKRDNYNITEILKLGRHESVPVWLETPRIVTQKDVDHLSSITDIITLQDIDGVMVNDYGSLKLFKDKGCQVLGGAGLNIINQAAAILGTSQGLQRITASPELDIDILASLLKADLKVELTVHGPICGIITDYCLAAPDNNGSNCGVKCRDNPYKLLDLKGQSYQIKTDYNCRNYIFHPFDLCLYNYLIYLGKSGLQYVRIDGQFYESSLTGKVTAIYRQAIDRINNGEPWVPDDYNNLIDLFPSGLTSLPLFIEK
ncbi:MAG TPA: U32 family peptidase [Syntrophomonadaceae bacterium]|nr:U32 family peptidase [Syntrophomonadaceae bacterium]HNX29157.1 U32 family peptidase [Syntrophomonadaceae bacterium]HPR93670.1 U32 family peptidase [Syntrophomonadaceae bacterium]